MSGVVFIDTETTGLDPDRHEIWEVGLIDEEDKMWRWFLPVDLARADTIALNIGRYHERHPRGHSLPDGAAKWKLHDPADFAKEFAKLTWGKHLAGAVVSFDAERLANLLRANGQAPGWHYHLIDVEALAVGYLAAQVADQASWVRPPWKSDEITAALGVKVDDADKHTALGDARWAKAIYEAVMGE